MGIASKKRSHKQATLLAAAIGAGAMFTQMSLAADYTWDGGSTSTNNWSAGTNWLSSGAANNQAPVSGANVIFGTSSDAAILDSSQTIGSMTFSLGSNYTLGVSNSSSLTINSGITTIGSGDTYTLSPAVILGGNNAWTVAANTSLTLSAAISQASSGLGILKSGTGTLNLNSNNTYTGATTILGGVVNVTTLSLGGSASGIGSAGSLASNLIISGGTLRWIGSVDNMTDRNISLGINGGTIDSSASTSTTNVTFNGSVAPSATSASQTFTLAGSNTGANIFAGVIADGAGANVTNFTKDGTGKWQLNTGNTYTGSTTINNGTLAYGASNILSDSTAVTLNGSGAVMDLGANRSDTIGGLTLVSGTVTGSTSSLTVNSGSYDIRSGTIGTSLRGSVGLAKTTSGTATITVAAAYTGATSITDGTLITGVSNAIASTGSVTVAGSAAVLDLGNSHTLTQAAVVLDGDATITGSGTSAITLSTGSYDLRNGSVSVPLKGSVGLEKTTSGTVTLTAGNTLTGTVNVRGGTLKLTNADGTLAAATSVKVHSGGTLQLDNTVSSEINNDRIGAVDVNLLGGTLHYLGDDGTTYSDETVSRLVLSEGASTLSIDGASSNGNGSTRAVINFNNGNSSADLVRTAGSTLRFVNDANNRSEAVVTNFTETNGIIGGWALYGDGTFAALGGTNTGSIVAATVDSTSSTANNWTAAQNVRLTGGATSTVNPTGSSVTVNSLALATSSATISISTNKSLVVESGGIALANVSHMISGAGSITAGASSGYELVVHNNSLNIGTIATTIANNGGNALTLTKGGIGHLRLTGANTYTGPTYVAAGTLSLAATNNNIASSSMISVQNGATLNVASISSGFKLGTNQKLKGSGTVAGDVTADAVGSTIAPGNSPGKLTFTGNLTLSTNATYEAQIGGASGGTGVAGIDFDQILVSGSSKVMTLGSANLKILPMPGIVIGQPYRIVATSGGATISGLFKNLAHNVSGAPYTQGNVSFNIDYGIGGGYVDVTFSAVPEPTSLSVLALGACGLLKRRRRASKR